MAHNVINVVTCTLVVTRGTLKFMPRQRVILYWVFAFVVLLNYWVLYPMYLYNIYSCR